MPHVANTYTHGSTRFTEHGGRNTFLNVTKDDNFRYNRSLVGNWVEERKTFPQATSVKGPLGGTMRPDAQRLSETTTIYTGCHQTTADSRLMATRRDATRIKVSGEVGAEARIMPQQQQQSWTGTAIDKLTAAPDDSDESRLTKKYGPHGVKLAGAVTTYSAGCFQGQQERPMRKWNRHILNYECQFENASLPSAKPASAPKLGEQYNPYLSTHRASFRPSPAKPS